MRIYVLFLVRYSILREYPLKVGVDCDEVPPVPIPNTVVKLLRADNTWRATSRKHKSPPELSETLDENTRWGFLFYRLFVNSWGQKLFYLSAHAYFNISIPFITISRNDTLIAYASLVIAKNNTVIRGKKTDKRNAKWIADLFKHDLIASSFIPDKHIRDLRNPVRYRFKLRFQTFYSLFV